MTQSPWSLQPTTETITDEHGNSMQVPSLGSWTVNEIVGVQDIYSEYAEKDAGDIELYSVATAFLLHSRGVLDSADSALLNGMPLSLLLAVWGFFKKENETLGSSEGTQRESAKFQRNLLANPSNRPRPSPLHR
jgi:hypothetical protein